MRNFLLAVALLVAASLPAFALDLGDKAPEITPDTWVTGEAADPVKADGSIYLVEVWSVTCPPCVKSIPILNDIQKRYADKGLKIVSFTTDGLDEVKEFLAEHPMEYSSFIDKEGGSYINYMAADNRNTIPHAFLFDKEGYLVWIGNPLDNLEERVKQVIAGTLNRERAVATREALQSFQTAFNDQNIDKAIEELKKLQKLEPDNIQYYGMHYQILTDLAYGGKDDVKAVLNDWYANSQENAASLAFLSMVARTQANPLLRFPELSLAAAKKAYAVAPDAETKLLAGRNLSEAYLEFGQLESARKTVDGMLAGTIADPQEKMLIEALRDYYAELQKMAENPDAEFKP